MYEYEGGTTQKDRLAVGKDHCGSTGPVFEISTLIVDGRIVDPDNRATYLTTTESDPAGKSKVLIYAVDGKHQMNVAVDTQRGTPNAVKHETLFHNAPVRAAGELVVTKGIVTGINDQSGTYHTQGMLTVDPTFKAAVLKALAASEVPITPALLSELRKT